MIAALFGIVSFCSNPTIKSEVLTAPSLFSPINGDTLDTISPKLIWTTVSGAAVYELQIALNDSFSELIMDDSLITDGFKIVSPLPFSTRLFWRVRAKNANNYGNWSPIWSFITCKRPADSSEIVLLTPKGGEAFQVGDSLKVTWKLQGNGSKDIFEVDIEISPDNGKTWGFFLSGSSIVPNTAQWENFSWKIPSTVNLFGTIDTLANDSKCLLRVEQYSTNDPSLMSVTKTPFTILLPPLVLVKPVGGESYKVGDTMKIEWQINDSSAISQGSVIIWNSIDGGLTWPSTRVIGNGSFLLTTSSYSWVIDSSCASNNFKICVTDYNKGNRSQSGVITITN
jgi:hypothetical protein